MCVLGNRMPIPILVDVEVSNEEHEEKQLEHWIVLKKMLVNEHDSILTKK
jgi:hypothetical protein